LIPLIIISAVLILVGSVLFLPLKANLGFKDDFWAKITFAGITLFSTDKEEKEQKSAEESQEQPKAEAKKDNIFDFLKQKYGFFGAVKKLLLLLREMLSHIKGLLRHIKIKKAEIDINISGGDAAQTAIEYGAICSAAYPLFGLLEACRVVKFKRINIKSDFDGGEPLFEFSTEVSVALVFLIISAIKIYKEYKKFITKENYDG